MKRFSVACSALSSTFAAFFAATPARADRVIYVERVQESPEGYAARDSLDLAVDAEGAVPLMDRRFASGNDLSGGGGFKVRVGDQIRLRRIRFTPELGYAFDHLFASDSFTNTSYAWDMHRIFAGARLGVGYIVVPTVYAHIGYGWRDTADPTVARANGVAFDLGFALDFHVVPHLGFGGHVEYATMDAEPYTPDWIALGLHADVAF